MNRRLAEAAELLQRLRERLDAGLEFDTRRAIVECLGRSGRVESTERDGKPMAVVTVQFEFTTGFAADTGKQSDQRSDEVVSQEPHRRRALQLTSKRFWCSSGWISKLRSVCSDTA